MAVRREELWTTTTSPDAQVLDFPVRIARARARRAQRTFLVRRTMVGLIALALTAGIITASAAATGREVSSRPDAPASVLVQPGQTLWDLAERYAPADSDPRVYVDELASLNGVSDVLQAGDRLKLP